MNFNDLYNEAKKVLNPRQLAKYSYAGSVASALLTIDGHVYTGVCINTPASMGFCAEHAAIATMITRGEHRIVKMISVYKDGSIIAPCGRCREFISKVHDDNYKCEVQVSKDTIVTIQDLLPMQWNKK